MIVVTVFRLIMNQTELRSVHNKKNKTVTTVIFISV